MWVRPVRLLARSFVRFLVRTPWTSLTALAGVSLGVASTVAVHLISLSVADALEANRTPHLRGVTHLAERRGATMSDYFELRRRWRGGEFADVLALVPIVEGQVVDDGRRLQVVGADWLALYGLPSERATASLRPGSLVVDAGLGLVAGENLRLGGTDWPVAGAIESGVRGGLFADIGDALYLLQAPPQRLDSVGVGVKDRWRLARSWLESLLPGLSAGLPAGPQTLAGWDLHPVSVQQPGAAFANSILFNLGALGSLALLVAWFLIYQVCVLWLRRQAPVLDSLFALGASRVELAACFLVAVALLGVLATLVGTLAGALLADLLTDISTGGLDMAPRPELSAAVIAKALLSGLGVSVLGAWMAFRRWRRSAHTTVHWVGKALWFALALALIAAGTGYEQTGLAGGFAAILAAALLTAALVAPLLRVLRRGLGAVRFRARAGRGGLLARLALREATWFAGDVGAALGALALAVATSVGVGLMVDSFKLDFERMLNQRLAHEFSVELPHGDGAAIADAVSSRWPGARTWAYGELRTRIDGRAVQIRHTAFSAVEAARYGYAGTLGADQALASEGLLLALGVDVGEVVEVGGVPVRIAGSFADFGAVMPRLLLDDVAAAQRFGALHHTGLGISGVPAGELDTWLAGYAPGVTLRPRERARARALEIFDRSFAITNALTLLALTVAVAGLYNAMVGLRLNRLATSRLLTALGLTAMEDRCIELVRALGLGAFAVLLALPLGVAMGAMLCDVINPRAFGWRIGLSMSAPALAWPMALGLLAAVAAALAPAPREPMHVH